MPSVNEAAEKDEKRIPRGLKSARDDKGEKKNWLRR